MYNTKALIVNTYFFPGRSFISYIFVLAAIWDTQFDKIINETFVPNCDYHFTIFISCDTETP